MRHRIRHLHRNRFSAPPADPTLVDDAARLGDPPLLFEALAAQSTWLLFAERLDEAERLARQALALYDADPSVAQPGDDPALAHLYNRLHVLADWSGRVVEGYRFGAEALVAAGPEFGQGVLLADVFHSEVSLGLVGRATQLYATSGWRPAFRAPGGRWAEVSIARLIASEGDAYEPISRMIELAEQHDAELPDMLRWNFAAWGAAYAVEQGHWALVERALRGLDELGAELPRPPGRRQRAEVAVMRAELDHARGDAATMRRRLAELAAEDDPYNAGVFARAAMLRATDALDRGRPAEALDALADAVARYDVLPKHLGPRYHRLRRAALEAIGDYAALAADLALELDGLDGTRHRAAPAELLGDDLAARLEAVFDELQTSLVGHLRWEQGEVAEAISHDLAGAAALVRLSLDLFDTDRERVSVVLGAATQRMRAIVDSFALLVSLEHSRLRPALTAHPFAALVDRVVANVRPLAEAKQMTIVVEHGAAGAAEVLADTGFFEMALANVIANAVKYAPPGSPISVRLAQGHGMVTVSVTDTGPGLADHELDSVFERHVRGRARPTGNEPSLGLGLYISRAICELMGGRIWAESPGPGLGSTFTMTLPEAAEPVVAGIAREGATR